MSNIAIERKYLILRPSLSAFEDYFIDAAHITQIYLNSRSSEERRVSRIVMNSASVGNYFYTVKRTMTSISREEKEIEIGPKQYETFLDEADKNLKPLKKVRYRFNYEGQLFKLDFYDFSREFAILKLELPSKDSKITLPPFFKFVREVTTNKKYSNRSLAKLQTLK